MSERRRYLYLDGIRGAAACIVMLHHLQLMFFYDSSERLFNQSSFSSASGIFYSFVNFFFDGQLAVYIFWFMSAYVISAKVFTDDSRNYVVASFSKRYFRLVIPAFGSVMLAYVLLSSGLMYNLALNESLERIHKSVWLTEQYNFPPNFFMALRSGLWDTFFDYLAAPSYNNVLWTMSPELYGSLVCFSLAGILAVYSRRFFVYCSVFAVCFLLTQYWLCSFLLGLMLCDVDRTRYPLRIHTLFQFIDNLFSRWWLSIPILFILIIVGGRGNYFDVANLFISAGIVFVIMRAPHLQRVFELSLFQWLGRISFPVYLLHVIIYCSLSGYLFLVLQGSHVFRALVASAAGTAVSFIAARLYLYVDDYAVRLSNRIGSYVVSSDKRD